ncbi:MAG: hypothetical protein E6G47_05300 [Actinobacteria bacterium]|nr:MAG: hypothetical protein E6G47_05300 [Actinomycetota bacterium]
MDVRGGHASGRRHHGRVGPNRRARGLEGAAAEGRVTAPLDAIVVGGGHNGLVTAAYLAKAGRRTLVLERREEPGGAAELALTVGRLSPTVVRDLRLTEHGVAFIRPAVRAFAPLGRSRADGVGAGRSFEGRRGRVSEVRREGARGRELPRACRGDDASRRGEPDLRRLDPWPPARARVPWPGRPRANARGDPHPADGRSGPGRRRVRDRRAPRGDRGPRDPVRGDGSVVGGDGSEPAVRLGGERRWRRWRDGVRARRLGHGRARARGCCSHVRGRDPMWGDRRAGYGGGWARHRRRDRRWGGARRADRRVRGRPQARPARDGRPRRARPDARVARGQPSDARRGGARRADARRAARVSRPGRGAPARSDRHGARHRRPRAGVRRLEVRSGLRRALPRGDDPEPRRPEGRAGGRPSDARPRAVRSLSPPRGRLGRRARPPRRSRPGEARALRARADGAGHSAQRAHAPGPRTRLRPHRGPPHARRTRPRPAVRVAAALRPRTLPAARRGPVPLRVRRPPGRRGHRAPRRERRPRDPSPPRPVASRACAEASRRSAAKTSRPPRTRSRPPPCSSCAR